MHIKKAFAALVIVSLWNWTPLAVAQQNQAPSSIEITYQKFVLDNGLTLIVHEDRKAPIVAVNVWYHVGSKNEKSGKTGFAHLFEHLMFNGSENFNDDYFKAVEKVGATDLNGTTSEDRTNYFQNAPKEALDLLLWMESDRMGHLLGAITQAKLDEQRGVVQNEKRQGENQPYAISEELITKNTWPPNHPYSWTVIGSMEDLNAASLDDVRGWFKEYYGAANATIVIAGDVDAPTALERTKRYFGDIPPGPPVTRHEAWVAKRSGSQRQVAQDRVPQSRIYKVWNIPQWGAEEADYLNLVSDVLAIGKTSRLYKRLVYDEQTATDVAAYVSLNEIAGQFVIMATAKPDGDLAAVEKAIDEELARFIDKGPTEEELKRAKNQYVAGFIRGIERIGGFGGKSDILAHNQVFKGDPSFYKTTLRRTADAKAEQLQGVAKKWLSDGVYALEIHPFPKYTTAKSDADRSKLPAPEIKAAVKFPDFERTQLSNGLKVVFAERHAVPLVNFELLVDAGFASDQLAAPGTARLAMDMLDEGTKTRSALDISDELALLGATLDTGSRLDFSTVTLSALKENLDGSLQIFADVIQNPNFPTNEFSRLQNQRLAAIKREKAEPVSIALRVFPGLLYGKDHAYGNPLTGSGTEASVSKMNTADMKKFHRTWFRPNNATLIVVGDAKLSELTPKLERFFRDWESGEVPKKNLAQVEQHPKAAVYLIDRPGSLQSIIYAGHVAPPKANPNEIAIETMNNVLGGSFVSRLNMNLREDKHWAYGAHTILVGARGQRPFIAYAPVQSDKTKESIQEMAKELREIRADRPITETELKAAVENQTLRLPGSWETIRSVSRSIAEIIGYNLPEDYFKTYSEKVRALDRDDVAQAAKVVIHPDNLVWVIVGDRAKIEDGIRELNLGELQLLDADGKRIEN